MNIEYSFFMSEHFKHHRGKKKNNIHLETIPVTTSKPSSLVTHEHSRTLNN